MSAPMVLAILAGAKTQTRRVITDHPGEPWKNDGLGRITSKHPKQGRFGLFVRRGVGTDFPECDIVPCRYGMPGDRLWVRESHSVRVRPNEATDGVARVWYRADSEWAGDDRVRWTPSIHMHRWASRILLEVTGVRVERLQDISIADAIAEGCPGGDQGDRYAAVTQYRELWDALNAANRPTLPSNVNSKRYARVKEWLDKNPDTTGWAANPWVWAITFKVVQP